MSKGAAALANLTELFYTRRGHDEFENDKRFG